MIIAQISDSHIDPESPHAATRLADLARCVAVINGLDPQPDAVIHTGDMTHNGSPAKYAQATAVLKTLRAPLYVAAGNRDDRALIRAEFPAGRDLMPGSPYVAYSVDDHAVRLIAVDTLSETSNMGAFCAARADALAGALAQAPDRPTVLFMHHPPFEVTTSKYRWQFENRDDIAVLGRAMAENGKVVRVFCGHAHRDAVGEIAGVTASSMPSVAVDLRLGEVPAPADVPVFQVHTLTKLPDGGRPVFITETRAAA